MEYGTYKTGVVEEAMYSSFTSFSQKMSGSFSTMLVGVILTLTGFDALTDVVVNNGFEDLEDLVVLGNSGFEQYVEGGVDTVSRAMQGVYGFVLGIHYPDWRADDSFQSGEGFKEAAC